MINTMINDMNKHLKIFNKKIIEFNSCGFQMTNRLANTATKTILHPTIINIPVNDIKLSIKQKINMAWQSYWDSTTNKKRFKKMHEKWHISQNLSRRQEVTRPKRELDIFF